MTKVATFRQSKVLCKKTVYFQQITLAPIGATMNNEREIGVVVLSTHPIGQEGAAILRKPRGVTGLLCLPICYTPIVLASHRSVTLHYSQSHVTLSILSHYYSITQGCNAVQWHSNRDIRIHLGQGAKGPLKTLGAQGSLTELQKWVF